MPSSRNGPHTGYPEGLRGPSVSSSYTRSASPSHLSRLFRADNSPKSPPLAPIAPPTAREEAVVAVVAEGDSLLPKNYGTEDMHAFYGAVTPVRSEHDLESQQRHESLFRRSGMGGALKWPKVESVFPSGMNGALKWPKVSGLHVMRKLRPKRRVTAQEVWKQGVVQPVSLLPAVLLGLLLNVLDGLSYGKWFPLFSDVF